MDRIVGGLYDRGQQGPVSLRLVALRDIAEDGGDGHHYSGGVSDGGPGEGCVEPPPVFAHAHALVLREDLALGDLIEDVCQPVQPVGWHQDGRILPDGVRG